MDFDNETVPYEVKVVVTALEVTTGGVPTLLIQVEPEVLELDGLEDRQIKWQLYGENMNSAHVTGPFFGSPEDVKFMTPRGQERFSEGTLDPSGTSITRTVIGEETDQTIYTYLLTVRLMVGKEGSQQEIAISIDPEVDNPPPAPK